MEWDFFDWISKYIKILDDVLRRVSQNKIWPKKVFIYPANLLTEKLFQG